MPYGPQTTRRQFHGPRAETCKVSLLRESHPRQTIPTTLLDHLGTSEDSLQASTLSLANHLQISSPSARYPLFALYPTQVTPGTLVPLYTFAWLLSLRGSPPSPRLTRKARPGSARPSLHSSYSPLTRASRSTATLDLLRHGHVPMPRLAPEAPLLVALTPLTGFRARPPAHVPPTD